MDRKQREKEQEGERQTLQKDRHTDAVPWTN